MIICFLLAGIAGVAQIPNVDQYQAQPVTNNTIYGDTNYSFQTYRNSTWNVLIKFSGLTANDTVWVKIRQSSDNGVTWEDYASMDSVQVLSTHPQAMFEDPDGALGTNVSVYCNLAVKDTVTVTKLLYTLKRKY
jgi:hypothetical protein